jgi:hypothetical protein
MNRVRRSVLAAVATITLGAVMVFTPTAAFASNCPITVGGHAGSYVCEYPPHLVQWPDGHYQWFVVGTDPANHIYDTYEISPGSNVWSNWRSLGGTGRSGVDVDFLSSSRIDISVIGTDNGWWCNRWTSSSNWSGWFACFR